MDEERTIDFTLDKLDFEPNSIFGFTMTEFLKSCGVFCTSCGFVLGFLTLYLVGVFMYGLIFGAMIGVVITTWFAFRGETYKKGRPSYMIWIDLKHKLQTTSNTKLNMGFIESSVWDTRNASNNEKQRK